MINIKKVIEEYNSKCAIPSDINQLLPYLLKYAKKCKHITEMGVRDPTSTYAFLAGKPDKVISYDISRSPGVDEVDKVAPGVFKFVLKDVLEADIEETDFLFIDTYHTASQLEKELLRHASKVRKYIGFHDTDTFWEVGEHPYRGISEGLVTGKGLKYAIEPFLASEDWKIAFMTDINNGLLIVEKKKAGYPLQKQLFTHLKYTLYLRLKKLRKLKKNIKPRFREFRKTIFASKSTNHL